MEAGNQLSVVPQDLQAMISQTYGYDFPSFATVGIKNDDAQDRILEGCVANHWNLADDTLIAKSAEDLARLESCVAGLAKYAEFVLALSGGEYRDNALKLQAALHARLDGQ